MAYYLARVALTTLLVVVIAETAKRNTLAAAILASVPLISVLAMIWLYVSTGDAVQVAGFARNVAWLVLPSLTLFLVLPILLERGHGFYISLAVAIAATVVSYYMILVLVRHNDIPRWWQ